MWGYDVFPVFKGNRHTYKEKQPFQTLLPPMPIKINCKSKESAPLLKGSSVKSRAKKKSQKVVSLCKNDGKSNKCLKSP